ncbi:hypothetical protein CANARDRAFT_26428 [[Candida] arabinofermentans NRRL YB-2248]|uniref:Uncharacterized protein n=1 Tax=[Candida] arabinofermentans NRRL YB-2248 TaxID=983967 RepID=A0A1E4T918_9ASCO|nr:hypothetical protein CANARDRAFT_26428 [[Candida] arabinofermentans NRRL YB-2248]
MSIGKNTCYIRLQVISATLWRYLSEKKIRLPRKAGAWGPPKCALYYVTSGSN